MITLNFAHLCEMAFLSQNGNLNLIGIFEKVSAPQFPATFPRLSMVVSLKTEKGSHTCSIVMKNSAGLAIITPININLTVKEPDKNIRLIGDINNLQIKEPGTYSVQISVNGNLLHTSSFTVEKAPQPIPQGR